MRRESKSELVSFLEDIKTEADCENFIKGNVEEDSVPFHIFFRSQLDSSGVKLSQVMEKSRLNKNYGYNILSGNRSNPGRDKVIALCIGAKMDYEQVLTCLRIIGASELNPKKERDIWIAMAINSRMGDVLKVNLLLEEKGIEPLDV